MNSARIAVSMVYGMNIDSFLILFQENLLHWKRHLQLCFHHFFTSLHAHISKRYFTEKKRHWSERAWWLVAFTLSTIACGYLIYNVYVKWVLSPVIVSFAEKSTPIWEIPFPAVTICPETKTYMKKLNFTDVWNAKRIGPTQDLEKAAEFTEDE